MIAWHRVKMHFVISIHALRKESDLQRIGNSLRIVISIHALRKESDVPTLEFFAHEIISIHALRKESDLIWWGRVPDR